MLPDNITEEVLDLEIDAHIRSVGDFTCGNDHPLNDFLCCFASDYMKKKYGKTYLLMYEDEILGYYTIKTGSVSSIESYTEIVSLPLIEVARLAVSYDLQGCGIGKYIFLHQILEKVKYVSQFVAVYGIMVFVVPDDEQAIHYYQSLGFKKASEKVQAHIESFSDACDLYILKL